MDRFKEILVVTAPATIDNASLRRVRDLALHNRAKVVLFDVVEPLPSRQRYFVVGGKNVDLEQLLEVERAREMKSMAALFEGVEVECVARAGKPSIEVIRHVLDSDADLVIVGDPCDPEQPGIPPPVMQLLRKCPVPVWVMRSTRSRKLRILALVDPDPDDPSRDELNGLVLELSAGLARREGADLHVAHAWHLPAESTLRSSAFVALPGREVDLMVIATQQRHQEQLDDLAARHGLAGLGAALHLVNGAPGEVLPPLAKKLDINLIVMGTVARTGLSGFVMGNTAESLLRSVCCSVLAVKPSGFQTPVRVS